MPQTARIEWYDPRRGFGVLVTDAGERVSFDGEAAGAATSGDAVTVEWRRAKAGPWNVPARIVPLGFVPAPPPPELTLAEWLAGFAQRCSKIRGISQRDLLDGSGDALEPFVVPTDDGHHMGRGTGEDAVVILSAIADLARFEPRFAKHARWVRAFDCKERDEWTGVAEMIDVDPAAVLRRLRGRGELSLAHDFVPTCNALATGPDRLYCAKTDDDSDVVVALPPDECAELVARGYLVLIARAPEVPPWRRRATAWLARVFGTT
jgi:hypothetical protein